MGCALKLVINGTLMADYGVHSLVVERRGCWEGSSIARARLPMIAKSKRE
jgi:hypothetical protein